MTLKSDDPIVVGVVGGGFVGKATMGFTNTETKVIVYDIQQSLCIPKETTLNDIYECDVVFVAVPTPMSKDGSCYTEIVETVVLDLQKNHVQHIVVRSTVPVGTCKKLGVHFMPEFLTEKNWKEDFYTCPMWVIGTDNKSESFIGLINHIFDSAVRAGVIVSNNIMWKTTMEAELVKYTRNCFLATKVGFFNEIYSYCEKLGIDYDEVKAGVVVDPRIGPSHTNVPNHEYFNGKIALKRGFGGTCLCKENQALIRQYEKAEVPSPILNAVWQRNITIDRPERDWEFDKGRAVV